MGALFFSFQMYGDFSGYSDIAIGTSRLFGFNLKKNFAYPYFARDIAEFWRRWHISLSSWFRDYIYFPLGGSRFGTLLNVRNMFIIFLVSGFWHGANWTFIVWGAMHAVFYLPLLLLKRNRKNLDVISPGRFFPSIREFIGILITFGLCTYARIFFRADNLSHAFEFTKGIFTNNLFTLPLHPDGFNVFDYGLTLLFVFILFFVEWIQRNQEHGLFRISHNWLVRWSVYLVLIVAIVLFGGSAQDFIYFQF
jgi:D-alanyl-lipoteichoic acid acyltransferase DltB (MBOAT superfamily)